jgi:hypothetical protein
MKSKALTYTLIVSVIAVWGIIFYRVFLTVNNDEDYLQTAKAPQKEALTDYRLSDTGTLVLNYRDPFLGISKKEEPKNMEKSFKPASVQMEDSSAKEAINWDFIKYNGFIVNPANKKVISIVSIHGTEKMMTVGEVSGGVKLLRNFKDSVKVSYKGETRFISLK